MGCMKLFVISITTFCTSIGILRNVQSKSYKVMGNLHACSPQNVCLTRVCLLIVELAFTQVLSNVPELPGAGSQVTFESLIGGSLVFRLSLDYYNRLLSGWEPLIEPWRLKASWTGNPSIAHDALDVKINSKSLNTRINDILALAFVFRTWESRGLVIRSDITE